ncbi:hypothetical protein [Vibrio sp. LaRot3]|uniref:hypothetical protein n=1 Tax=Vibrio sp. LaRot3 TaxID=2998829 RepID=UPI0022CE2EFD|nr:hypothetical protein [Vibrio sp. LaRot3]MDA0150088.1 hypothetical protein [Vibrio sp. LaRot3]
MIKPATIVLSVLCLQFALAGCSSEEESSSEPSPPAEPTFPTDYVCGKKLNDKNTSAGGKCLKTLESSTGDWFTSSPSTNFASEMGFTSWVESKHDVVHGPNFIFVKLSQAKSWCSTLNNIAFAGRTNWQVPDVVTLNDFDYELSSVTNEYGWPGARECYRSSTEIDNDGKNNTHYAIDIGHAGSCFFQGGNDPLYVTCHSNK